MQQYSENTGLEKLTPLHLHFNLQILLLTQPPQHTWKMVPPPPAANKNASAGSVTTALKNAGHETDSRSRPEHASHALALRSRELVYTLPPPTEAWTQVTGSECSEAVQTAETEAPPPPPPV